MTGHSSALRVLVCKISKVPASQWRRNPLNDVFIAQALAGTDLLLYCEALPLGKSADRDYVISTAINDIRPPVRSTFAALQNVG